jgi:hypothetical protein
LASDQSRVVDHQRIRGLKPIEGVPGSLKQNSVAGTEADSPTLDVFPLSLYGQDDEVAAARGLSGKYVLTDDW